MTETGLEQIDDNDYYEILNNLFVNVPQFYELKIDDSRYVDFGLQPHDDMAIEIFVYQENSMKLHYSFLIYKNGTISGTNNGISNFDESEVEDLIVKIETAANKKNLAA